MKKQNIIINTFLSLALGCFLIYIVFDKIDLKSFYAKLSEVNYSWIYLSMFISIFEHVLRGYRWNLLMRTPKTNLSTYVTTNVMIVSYFFALFIPRFNDFIRCYLISKTNNIKVSTSLGTVVSERIFDLISLFLILLIFIVLEFELFYSFLKEYVFVNITLNLTNILVLLFAVIMVFILIRYLSKNSKMFSEKFEEFKTGFFSVGNIYKNKAFIVSTVLLWVIYFLMGYVIFFSFNETSSLGINAGFAVLIAGSIGMIVPVNAGIGAYHFLVASILISYNINYESGLFFATLLHTSQIICLAILGVFSSIILFLKIRSNEK
ncbi:MAG: lysylphosphatidylglycerol synthase transmembrane domain-containing protein [Bacteroidota bacterium]|nr:lysylphosphatidylglycerol synthase transmembrane domain-containing protein [Bacteroidota bacterium]